MSDEEASNVFQQAINNYLSSVRHLLEDESVTEIMINGPSEIWAEIAGKVQKTDAEFPDEDSLRAAMNNIAQSVGRVLDELHPRLDARLPNGYRIAVVIPPCARNGTTVAIRKFSAVSMTLKDYVKFGSITQDAAQFLDICMKLGKNILVSGGTGSGKTTLLGVLADRIPKGQRVIVIEDSSELAINYEHVVSFETRMENAQGEGGVSIQDLVKSSLRLRPDRIIVGEVRGHESLDLIQAMNTGHKGCLGTIHANTANDALVRLEALAQGGESKISEKALQQQISSALDIVIQISRFGDGSRRIKTIAEVLGYSPTGIYQVEALYDIGTLKKGADGKLHGIISPLGRLPNFMGEMEDLGFPFPRSKFSKPA